MADRDSGENTRCKPQQVICVFTGRCEMRGLMVTGLIVLLPIAGAAATWLVLRGHYEAVETLPPVEDIASMSVTLPASDYAYRPKAIPEFAVPQNRIAELLWFFQEPRRYSPAAPIKEWHAYGVPTIDKYYIAEVKVIDKSGRRFHIDVYAYGHNPILFTMDGRDYFWGNLPAVPESLDPDIKQPAGWGLFRTSVDRIHGEHQQVSRPDSIKRDENRHGP